jgi:hypothetical protein
VYHLSDYPLEFIRGTNTIDIVLPAYAFWTEYTAWLRFAAFGTDRRQYPGQRIFAIITEYLTFFSASNTILWEKKIECRPLEDIQLRKHCYHLQIIYKNNLMSSQRMSAIVYGFVDIDITISNFKIETAIRIGANPGFVLNRSTLTTEIGKGN